MIHTKFIFELLVTLLNPPADLSQAHQTQEAGVGGKVSQPELGRGCLSLRPFCQQPEDVFFSTTMLVAMAGQNTCGGETTGHRAFGALTPGDTLPAFL